MAHIPPSQEVREHARRRAEALAGGLFAHQVDGVAFLLGRRRAILADDMGLGKTRQSIIALKEARPEGPYLVVCPASVKQNWQREIVQVLPDASVQMVGPAPVPDRSGGWVIVNYDLLSRHIEALSRLTWQGLIFDEAHYLKNHQSQRSRQARRLLEAAGADTVVHALTGTPLTNRPRDLFPLLQLTGHPMARSFLSFAKRYCAAEHNGYGWVTDGASNLEELRAELHGVMLRRTKDEVLDLPPKIRNWLEVEVPNGTARAESRAVLELLLRADQGGRAERSQLLSKLSTARRKIAVAKVRHTIDFIDGALAQGEKLIVFSCFEQPVERIAAHFGDAALLLTGKTPQAKRQAIVDRFQSDDSVRVLVANLVAGGVGLNLTAAPQVVFNDLDWVPANHWQAEDRAYRIGQNQTVNVTYIVASETIDEFVANALEAKSQLVDAVVEGAGDVLSELESALAAFSPRLADLSDADAGEDSIDRLLREISRDFERKTAARELRTRPLSEEAIARLAAILAGPSSARYSIESANRPGVSYFLDVDGPDVVCTCPGFEYRGACAHARSLKAALRSGRPEDAGFVASS